MAISRDVQYVKLTNDLRDLKAKRDKIRPALYWLGMIVFGILVLSISGILWTLLFGILTIASFFAGLQAWSMRGTLAKQIAELETQIKALEAPAPAPV